MTTRLCEKCPSCGLILLCGAILDAAAKADELGPILGLNREAKPEDAKAGYVGISSLWLGDRPDARDLYRFPRCKAVCLVEDLDARST
jgi:hypothetical protein